MTGERVDALLVVAGVVLVLGSSAFVARVAWRLADRVVGWIASRRPAREHPRASAPPVPAPDDHPAIQDLVAARAAERRDALVGLQVAAHMQLGAAFRGDGAYARHLQHAAEHNRNTLCALDRAEESR